MKMENCNHNIDYHIKGWPAFEGKKRICEFCEIEKIVKKAEEIGKINRKDFVESHIIKKLVEDK